jgi:hypothetical protein
MKAKLRSYYVFSLYGGMRGAEGAFVGATIFAALWILAPLLVLGYSNETTQFVLSRRIIILIPGLLIIGLMASIVPGVVGGVLLSALSHNNFLKDSKNHIVVLKGFFVGALSGFLLWWFVWSLEPLNPPISIEKNLFVYYSITGILSAAAGGVWAARKLAQDSNYVLKDN